MWLTWDKLSTYKSKHLKRNMSDIRAHHKGGLGRPSEQITRKNLIDMEFFHPKMILTCQGCWWRAHRDPCRKPTSLFPIDKHLRETINRWDQIFRLKNPDIKGVHEIHEQTFSTSIYISIQVLLWMKSFMLSMFSSPFESDTYIYIPIQFALFDVLFYFLISSGNHTLQYSMYAVNLYKSDKFYKKSEIGKITHN